uniref:uncharacterized protein C16orf92 homolog n=1 Tax=Podarcis muralis TaxID=64176 RepID=UPI00109F8AE2|nr:uncharacterized protein C16orf92 homolog [Podarcis muralis]
MAQCYSFQAEDPRFNICISRGKARAGNPGNATETDLSRHQPLWFDYPDTDEKKILAIYKLIGEQPEYIPPSSFPHQLRYILVGSIILILLFFLYQIISKVYVSFWLVYVMLQVFSLPPYCLWILK